MKKALKTVFNAFAGAAQYAFVQTWGRGTQFIEDQLGGDLGPSVALTEGEAALVTSIFGDEVNTAKVKKRFSPYESYKAPDAEATAVSSRKVNFYEMPEQDFSTQAPSTTVIFVHEMTHVWQMQHPLQDFVRSVRNPTMNYDYTLAASSRFKDFGVEQQASLIEDYARAFILSDKNPVQDATLLQKVVEDRFPAAQRTRVALEKQAKFASPKA